MFLPFEIGEPLQFPERTEESAAEVKFDAGGGGESLAVIGQLVEGPGSAYVFVRGKEASFEFGRAAIHLHIFHGGLVTLNAAEAPIRRYQGPDEVGFGHKSMAIDCGWLLTDL